MYLILNGEHRQHALYFSTQDGAQRALEQVQSQLHHQVVTVLSDLGAQLSFSPACFPSMEICTQAPESARPQRHFANGGIYW